MVQAAANHVSNVPLSAATGWVKMAVSTVTTNSSSSPAKRRTPVLLALLGIGLTHTSVIFGINLSLADLVIPILLLGAVFASRLYIPTWPTAFFILISVVGISIAGFITPQLVAITPNMNDVLTDYVKLVTSFLYLVLGVNIARAKQAEGVLRVFALAAAAIGLFILLQLSVPGVPRIESMFFHEIRARGFMNDPNYFAVTQTAALAVLWHDRAVSRKIRYPALIILAVSVVFSGSKTGLLTMLVFFTWRLISSVLNTSKEQSMRSRIWPLSLVPALLSGMLVLLANPTWRYDLATRMEQVPALDRLAPLLIDFNTGIQADGSGRDSAWDNALNIIEMFPLTGIGIGTYADVNAVVNGNTVLAHNTFLQIATEWGLVLAAVFFAGVVLLFFKRPTTSINIPLWHTTRDAVLVLLVGSIGLSLNNSRLFWLALGILIAGHIFSASTKPDPKLTQLEER